MTLPFLNIATFIYTLFGVTITAIIVSKSVEIVILQFKKSLNDA